MSSEEAKDLKPLNTAALKVLTEDDSEDTIIYVNELPKTSDSPSQTKTSGFPYQLKRGFDSRTSLDALLRNHTTLPFSNYASPIFAQCKPNGRLRLLVDVRKINNLISDDHINNNPPVSTLTDVAQRKKLFCKLD